jgi:2-hydroxychromene-2-carboxylate isomerase
VASGAPTFYFDTNSPYAYLAATRMGQLMPDAVWRPVALGIMLRQQGRVPWSLGPERDAGVAECERRAAGYGLPPMTWPEGWPRDTWSFTPLRAAVVAEEEGALARFSLECYRKMFVEGRSQAELDTVLEAARAAGLEPSDLQARLETESVKDRLRAYTDEAMERGVVGVPTVAVGDRLFWGDDRLEEAAAAARAAAR